jgi:hypothetical protein
MRAFEQSTDEPLAVGDAVGAAAPSSRPAADVSRWIRWAALLPIVAFAALVSFLLILPAPSNRMAIDDFCYAAGWQEHGLWGMQVYFWRAWTGRFFATWLITFVSYLAHKRGLLAPYSLITFAALFAASILATQRWMRVPWTVAIAIGSFLVALLFLLTPDPPQSWYWLAGSASYLWPIIMAAVTLYLAGDPLLAGTPPIGARWRVRTRQAALGLAAFCATAGNETFGLLFLLTAALGLAAALWPRAMRSGRDVITILTSPFGIVFGASAASFLLMFLAPGNAQRRSQLHPVAFLEAVSIAAAQAPQLYLDLAHAHDALLCSAVALLTFTTAWFGADAEGEAAPLERIGKVILLALLVLASSIFYGLPAALSMAMLPPTRSHITVVFIALCAVAAAARLLAPLVRGARRSVIPGALVGAAAVVVLFFALQQIARMHASATVPRAYAAVYDANFVRLRAARVSPPSSALLLSSLPDGAPLYSAQVSNNPEDWVNRCVSRFFQLPGGVRR